MGIFEPICLELKSLRYLMNNIILKLHAQNEMLEVLFHNLKIEKPKKEKKTKKEIILEDAIKFDLFTLTRKQYEALLEDYGYDTVTRACTMLDVYIREKGRIPYNKPVLAIRNMMILKALKAKLEDIKIDVTDIKDIDSKLIDNRADAVAFIQCVPKHLRNVSPEVRELAERFNIKNG